jgi:hypothetical protein
MSYHDTILERGKSVGRFAGFPLFNVLTTITGERITVDTRTGSLAESAAAGARLAGLGKAGCPWLPFVQEQLNAIASLPADWDSYGAAGSDRRLVASAIGLIECLAQAADLPQPHVNPTRNGGVQFEWEAKDRYFELEVVGERAAEYFYCDRAARVEETGNLFEAESLETVLNYIRKLGTSHSCNGR